MKRALLLVTALAVVGTVVAAGSATAGTSHAVAAGRNGALHVTKDCSGYDGTVGLFCTITAANIRAIEPGMNVVYLAALPADGVLDADLVLSSGRGGAAVGHVVLDLTTAQGRVTFSVARVRVDGVGRAPPDIRPRARRPRSTIEHGATRQDRARSARKDVVTVDAHAFPVDSTNAEQASEWDGADGAYWAKYHKEYERLLGVFDSTLLEAGAVRSDDRSLDIGCGTGATTRALATRAPDGSAFGLDLSGSMLTIAGHAARRASIPNVEFAQGDAQVFPFEPASFDVAVSRMGCMFFGDPVTAFANIGRALRPGGRLALSVWQEPAANRWITAIDTALGADPSAEAADSPTGYVPGPFSLADTALLASLLERAGYVDVAVDDLDIPLAFGTVDDAHAFLETWIDDDLDPEGRARVADSLRQLLVDNASADGVLLDSATWLVTARRPGKAMSAGNSAAGHLV